MKSFVLSFTLMFLLACSGQKADEEQKPIIAAINNETFVMVAPVGLDDSNTQITGLGIVMSESEAKTSFKTGGIIRKCYVKEGSFVKKGQLLASLDMTEIDAQVSQAEEAYAKAERDYKRVENLYIDSVATLEQKQNAATALEVSSRMLEIARFNRRQSEIRSPIDGRVVRQMLYEGEIAGPGIPVYYIMGTGSRDWKVVVGLNDKDWAKVSIGDKAEVSFDAWPGKIFQATVTEKASLSGSSAGTLDITLKLREQAADMAAGLVANVRIFPPARSGVTVIPVEALVRTSGKSAWVYTIEDGKAKALPVRIGELRGNKVEIVQGLEGIKEVITTGSVYVADGDQVKVSNH